MASHYTAKNSTRNTHRRYSERMGKSSPRASPPARRATRGAKTSAVPSFFFNLKQKGNRFWVDRLSEREREYRKDKALCFYCGMDRTFHRDFWDMRPYRGNCYQCLSTGHKLRDCPDFKNSGKKQLELLKASLTNAEEDRPFAKHEDEEEKPKPLKLEERPAALDATPSDIAELEDAIFGGDEALDSSPEPPSITSPLLPAKIEDDGPMVWPDSPMQKPNVEDWMPPPSKIPSSWYTFEEETGVPADKHPQVHWHVTGDLPEDKLAERLDGMAIDSMKKARPLNEWDFPAPKRQRLSDW